MGNVIGIARPNARLVELLEELLREAKTGRLSSFAAILLKDGEADFAIETPDISMLEMVGAIEALKSELLSK